MKTSIILFLGFLFRIFIEYRLNFITLVLALIGMGTIIIIDLDRVELTNLNRALFRLSDVGRYKLDALKELISEEEMTVLS